MPPARVSSRFEAAKSRSGFALEANSRAPNSLRVTIGITSGIPQKVRAYRRSGPDRPCGSSSKLERVMKNAHFLAISLLCATSALAQTDPRKGLNSYLAGIGASQQERRSQAVAAIQTHADAERRQTEVRKKILELIGGLPERRGPVRVKEFGTIQDDGFRIEKIAYESMPDLWVTANVYVPMGTGPFPAVILTPGHGPGKESQYSWA